MDNYTRQSIKEKIQTIIKEDVADILLGYDFNEDTMKEIASSIAVVSILVLDGYLK